MGTYRTVTKSRAEMVFALQSLLSPLDRIAMVLVKHRRGLYFSTCYLPQIVIRFSDGDKGTWGTRWALSCALQRWPSKAEMSPGKSPRYLHWWNPRGKFCRCCSKTWKWKQIL